MKADMRQIMGRQLGKQQSSKQKQLHSKRLTIQITNVPQQTLFFAEVNDLALCEVRVKVVRLNLACFAVQHGPKNSAGENNLNVKMSTNEYIQVILEVKDPNDLAKG